MRQLAIGVVSEDPVVTSAVRESLGVVGEVREVPREIRSLSRPLPYDVLVLDVAQGDEASLALFVSCMTANYELPIVLTGADPGADVAVELLVLGAADYVVAPPAPDTLRRKVRRILTGIIKPAVDDPLLADLSTESSEADRRASYRAEVASEVNASIRISLDGEDVRAAIMDLSLAGERTPGALRVRASSEVTAPKLWMHAGRGDHAAKMYIGQGAEEAEPIEVRLRARRVRYFLRKRLVDVVMQYRIDDAEDARRVGRFWIRCQRRGGSELEYPPPE